jgi:hypothetical protein
MENWLNINQLRAYQWELNSNEEKLCSYFAMTHKWVTNRIKDKDGDYLCIAIAKLIKELPTIGKCKPNFSRSLNNLTIKKIFDKITNEENKKEVFYRFNPIYLQCWKDNSKIIASDLLTKNLIIVTEDLKVLQECNTYNQNKTPITKINSSVTELEQSVTELEQSVTEMEPISINNQINNQINNHHKDDDEKSSITFKKTEFNKLLNLYPSTLNNTPEKIAEALGVYLSFTQVQRVDSFKAVQNYISTEQVKSHINNQTTKYIMSLFTFLTKSYTKFIYGLPKNFNFTEEFEQKKSQVGAADDSAIIVYNQQDIDILKVYTSKFEEIKTKLINEKIEFIDDKYNYEWVHMIFQKNEFEILFVKMGGLNNVIRYSATQLAESMLDIIKAENE